MKGDRGRAVNGLLVIDKPGGITSRDAVNQIQVRLPRRTKIGHTGTLDPLATGVLVICIGNATRLAEYVQALDKVYRARLALGASSTTDDADGDIEPVAGSSAVAESAVRAAVARFIGEIDQAPPAYSAVKVDGKRAHDLARRGRSVDIEARKIRIFNVNVIAYDWPNLELEIHCGKGTYIRSLARDLGRELGCGAYVQELRRLRVGPFAVELGASLDDSAAAIREKILPPRQALSHMPTFRASDAQASTLRHGNPITAPANFPVAPGVEMAVFNESDELIGVGCADAVGGIRPIKIMEGIG